MSGSLPPSHENRGPGMIATTILVSALASVTVALRFATRIWIVRSVGWDDYTMLCAVFGIVISTGLVLVEVHYGFGRHKADLTKWQYIEFMKYSYGEWIQTFQTLMFTKISICFFLLRIPVERYLLRPIQGAIIALIASNIVLTLLWIFQCNPIASAWNKDTPGHCFTDAQLLEIIIAQAIISIISDFVLALFPIVLLWKVQIALRIKAGLCILMGLGLITAACCIVRTVLNSQNVNEDASWNSIPNWYWRSWEVCIGIIAACIPALRPGYKFVATGITSYVSSHRSMIRLKSTDVAQKGDRTGDRFPIVNREEARHINIRQPQASDDPALRNAAQAASTEAVRAKEFGAGEEGFAMRDLPGEMKTGPGPGIRKTTRIDVDGMSTNRHSQRDLELGNVDRRLGNRDFL